ncbi:YueI family protein [Virgibacillus soli]|uniref:YueI family protein n=1 Tax=Paracerasibacillus soli TaxID=480284 RepID=A0ABU5CVH4_9BACI|nr:YueI family protein [Virgibacillus soli]MDY0410326.1 YueI family protein [Virgibacillus soli]
MGNKSVDDYLTDGIYGTRLPKQEERNRFLGTLRERVVLALTIGQVMTDKGVSRLAEEMQKHPEATLIFNGHVANQFLKEEKKVAEKYNIPYTVITNEEVDTDIGAVLAYDYAIDKEDIFISENEIPTKDPNTNEKRKPFIYKLKDWLS